MTINVTEEIPVKIRDAFEASPGYLWVSCDYSQLEYRSMANLAEDEHLVKMFMEDVDFHTATASMMLGIPVDKVDKKSRKIGKCVTGDTLIYSPSHGLIRIDEVSDFREEDQFIPLDNFFVLNLKGEPVKAESFYYGGVRKVVKIKTKTGFILGGSVDKHQILVPDEIHNDVKFVKMSNLHVGDEVLLYRGDLQQNSGSPITVEETLQKLHNKKHVRRILNKFYDLPCPGMRIYSLAEIFSYKEFPYPNLVKDTIEEITYGEEEVFDLSVPDGHHFISNGFVSHNTLNFGVSYGMSVNGLAQRLGCTKEEAQQKQEQYFRNIPKIRTLIDRIKAEVKARGYSRTFFGRMRPFKKQLENAAGNWYREDSVLKQAFNTTIQGSSADLAKIALARCYQALKPYGERVRMLTQVHDEINFEVQCVNVDGTIDSAFLEEVLKVIDYAMSFRGVYPGWADVPADIEIGWNYGNLLGSDPEKKKKPGWEQRDEIWQNFGVDVLSIQANQPPTDLPKWLFENLDYDHMGKVAPLKKSSSKPSGTHSKGSDSSGEQSSQPTDSESSVGLKMARAIEKKMQTGNAGAQADLSHALFPVTTLVIKLKSGIQDKDAFDALKNHIADHFGQCDLVIVDSGMLYRLDAEYRVSEDLGNLEDFFDVKIFRTKPKVKLDL